ncbi:MAG TPA: hypothetical protein VL181_09040 [Holophagaceae bacterium]|nr:hypothetical protein [Holophagaceae bacterium]
MAMDASWDNSGLPPQKKGMPLWVKILGGCGLLVVLLIGSCVGFAAWGFHKVSTLGQSRWPSYVAAVKALEDPAGTKTLYEANPGLQKRFADEAAFEQQVAEWRPAIQTPPDQMPSLTTGRVFSFVGKNTHVQIGGGEHGDGRHEGGASGYKMNDGRFFVIAWEDGKIVDVAFERRDRR